VADRRLFTVYDRKATRITVNSCDAETVEGVAPQGRTLTNGNR
jgi:hypothetical protein